MSARVFLLLSIILTLGCYQHLCAQGPINDSLSLSIPTNTSAEDKPERISKSKEASTDTSQVQRHSPKRATLLSAVLPGAGQVYNKKYWKVPIIYAAAGGTLYGVLFNTKYYNAFRDAYKERLSTGTNVDPQYARLQDQTLQSARDYYRYYRDLSYIGLGAVYILQLVDASVDAHFFDFKITEDLSLNVSPIVQPLPQTASTQLLFTLKF